MSLVRDYLKLFCYQESLRPDFTLAPLASFVGCGLLLIKPTVPPQHNGSVTGVGYGGADRPGPTLEERESRSLLRFVGGGL
jgi:hypothetical protein